MKSMLRSLSLWGRRPINSMKLFFWIAITAGMIVFASNARAQTPQPRQPTDDEVNAVARQLYCPVCENIPLDVCPTQACAEWRDLIRLKLSQGWSADQIKSYFADQYGVRVLAEPPARGLNWLVYVIPPIAILAGVYILFRAFRSWRKLSLESDQADQKPPEAAAGDDPYIKKLEEELKNR
jgi:cytochrome c-type biogenesis protein CcmH